MFRHKVLILAVASLFTTPAWATFENELIQAVRHLAERVAQLEAANKRLEAALGRATRATAGNNTPEQPRAETNPGTHTTATAKPDEPDLEPEGPRISGALTMVGQRAVKGAARGRDDSQLNYRADLEVEIPTGTLDKLTGLSQGRFYAHLRAGQGAGLEPGHEIPPLLSATPNSTAFYLTNAEDASPILAQAWYQLNWPLGPSGSGTAQRLEFTLGKIDLFGFFDQNSVGDDESESFMNNVFVHNPLLDSGGGIGADNYGFAPGLILTYATGIPDTNRWTFSAGLFGAGHGAGFQTSFRKPLTIAQAAYSGNFLNQPGNWRLYAWTNGRTTPYANPFASTEERHSGWGLSLDQRAAPHLDLFARYGQAMAGRVKIQRAFTLGAQLGGHAWDRDADRLGLAYAQLSPSKGFEAAAPGIDANADGVPDFGFAPDGAEKTVELFYAWQVNETFQLTPSWQWIGRPAGNSSAGPVSILGLRAKASF